MSYVHKIGKRRMESAYTAKSPTMQNTLYSVVRDCITPENLVSKMLERRENWDSVESFIVKIMSKKLEEERRG